MSYPKNRGCSRFIENVNNSPFKMIGEYINMKTKISFDCEEHGVFNQTPTQFIVACGCKECAYKKRTEDEKLRLTDKFFKRAQKTHPELDFSKSIYIDTHTEIDFECKTHGKQSNYPMYIIQGTGCKKCSPKSKGEETVAKWLDTYKIKYVREHKFDDLRGLGGLPLRFDFYFPETNTLIEFDGAQHFSEPSGKWKYTHNTLKEHDKLKERYCYEKGFDLFRIPYFKQKRILDILLHLRRCCKI